MKTYEIIEGMTDKLIEFIQRRQRNIDNISNTNYSLVDKYSWSDKKVAVTFDEDGNIIGTPCIYCFEHVPRSPFSYSSYVGCICRECFYNVKDIEDLLSDNQKHIKTKRKKKNSVNNVEVDWDYIEGLIKSGKAKLTLLSQRYNIYNSEMKEILVKKYGSKIEFKRGRGGGIKLQ